jgi:hypothetical protein
MASQTSAVERVSVGLPHDRPSLLFGSPTRIAAADAIDLRWYFRNPPLVGVPESGFSGQLERAAAFSFGVMGCTKCGGRRTEPTRDGSGYAPSGKLGKVGYAAAWSLAMQELAKRDRFLIVTPGGADMLGLLGSIKTVTWEELREAHPYIPDYMCHQCPRCQGSGTVERRAGKKKPITARPTGGSMQGGGSAPTATVHDDSGVVRYGRISRLLEAVGRRSLWSRMAIEIYFSEGGSVVALWRYTDAGRSWLDRLPNPAKLAPDALFENERAAQKANPTEARQRMLAAVVQEADERWDEACRAWNEAVKP